MKLEKEFNSFDNIQIQLKSKNTVIPRKILILKHAFSIR